MLITCLFLLERIISVHACCWSHNRFFFVGAITGSLFVSIASINQFTSFYGFICLILCFVQSKWICTRPHVSTQGYLFVSFIVILLSNCQEPFGFLRNYLVLVIVRWHDLITDMVAQGGSFVHIQAVEHNWKKMTFFPGFALDFSINLTKVSLWFCPYFATFLKVVHGLIDSKIP